MRLSMCCVSVRARYLVPHRIRRSPRSFPLPASSLVPPLLPSPVSQPRLPARLAPPPPPLSSPPRTSLLPTPTWHSLSPQRHRVLAPSLASALAEHALAVSQHQQSPAGDRIKEAPAAAPWHQHWDSRGSNLTRRRAVIVPSSRARRGHCPPPQRLSSYSVRPKVPTPHRAVSRKLRSGCAAAASPAAQISYDCPVRPAANSAALTKILPKN